VIAPPEVRAAHAAVHDHDNVCGAPEEHKALFGTIPNSAAATGFDEATLTAATQTELTRVRAQ
jgi:hypothetical protein